MAPGKRRSFLTNNRGQYRYILVIRDRLSKFCWPFPTKTKFANEVHSIMHNFSTITQVLQNIYKRTWKPIPPGESRAGGKFEQTCEKEDRRKYLLETTWRTGQNLALQLFSPKLQEKSQHGTTRFKVFPSRFWKVALEFRRPPAVSKRQRVYRRGEIFRWWRVREWRPTIGIRNTSQTRKTWRGKYGR